MAAAAAAWQRQPAAAAAAQLQLPPCPFNSQFLLRRLSTLSAGVPFRIQRGGASKICQLGSAAGQHMESREENSR
ncbi:MAG: hypothetical protein ACYYK0_03850 [Candidatus Eutrophobiaceae bacterium]